MPLFIVDPINKAIGLSHSGWRGTVGKMGQVTLEAMAREYGTDPANVRVAIAPSICQSCYEVGEEVAAGFEKLLCAIMPKQPNIWNVFSRKLQKRTLQTV